MQSQTRRTGAAKAKIALSIQPHEGISKIGHSSFILLVLIWCNKVPTDNLMALRHGELVWLKPLTIVAPHWLECFKMLLNSFLSDCLEIKQRNWAKYKSYGKKTSEVAGNNWKCRHLDSFTNRPPPHPFHCKSVVHRPWHLHNQDKCPPYVNKLILWSNECCPLDSVDGGVEPQRSARRDVW